ncbi:MAG: type IV pili methyl-accepting chemotaxis transducer N-terminal domain-containing protein [Pseudomonas sp.]|uniref:type IV pili methyl-accepting chemotaxis transducer N-terminal domain-containing protein n=1 Tax=Pseudomonas sp. TaxID=306 RepID=UPI00299CE0CE|nr:type IV pili methyl-accepting chemotaxis transducer N-terminal domain-containing protein [Pseudomonas sp.]MDX1722750.1 type IV pili methyl-accepting chemotaxis transducer N-terminal domain-containing protein [Pseudomonas sp.]
MLKPIIAGLLFGLALLSPPSWAAINAAEAMNLSGMQRMLSQRIAKTYLMIGAEIRPDQAEQQLDQSIAKFESNYLALGEYAPTAQIRTALTDVGQTWQRYRELALSRPDKQQALVILELSDRLLAQSEQVVQLLERHSGGQSARLVNRSGRQRMLSQRIAKLYLAMSWRLPVAGLEQAFNQAVDEFDQALQELQQARQNTPAIVKGLQQAEAQWRFTRAGFNLSADSRFVPTVIATTSETLLWQMNELTSQYEGVMLAGS